jgi:membrane dipeptidase
VSRMNRAVFALTWIAAVVLGDSGLFEAAGGEPEKVQGQAALKPVSAEARRVHEAGMLFDGHNDLPWKLRMDGDMSFKVIDISTRLKSGHTDIPRLREGGLKAQFWSVFIPSEFEHPARTVLEQIDLVRRMVARYPGDFELATTADEVEGAVRRGKIASLIGIEGGVAIEHDLSMIRIYRDLGVSYMTLTHGKSLDWADSATDDPKCDGLSTFGERVVKEMNRVGMLVDLSHVSAATMTDAIRTARAPVIFSHSSAYAIAPSPRNVPDDVLKLLPANGGVVMVNFYSAFVNPAAARRATAIQAELRKKYPDTRDMYKAMGEIYKKDPLPRGTVSDVADHIDHIIKVAGIDHVGIGSDFDGIESCPEGLEDVSCYPRLTEELLRRGRTPAEIHKILGGNVLRAFREAGAASERLKKTTEPEVDSPPAMKM